MHRLYKLCTYVLATIGAQALYRSYQEKKSSDAIDQKLEDLQNKQTARSATL